MKCSVAWIILGGAVAMSAQTAVGTRVATEADCTSVKLGSDIPASAIGEPVSSITLNAPQWNPTAKACVVDGSMAPIDKTASARPIQFRVALPSKWNGRSVQLGGGGMNGVVPALTGIQLSQGYVTYGSDSGHQAAGFGRGRGAPPPVPNPADEWALNQEAIRNLGYMQMKKTHDAAMVLIDRMYGVKPQYNYYLGTSQGGREALTVVQRYPGDYDGVAANVPIVNFSSLMLAPALVRIQEKQSANWVPPTKVNAIRGEFIRQCDKLDGLADGIINNYGACRAIFDVKQGKARRDPWAGKRCPGNSDPNPSDTTANACLTAGQIETLQFVYTRYPFAAPLANGVKSFGMWLPNTDPSGSGLMVGARFAGQEGADPGARRFSWLGELGVTGFLMKDLTANPLDYSEGGKWAARRSELSQWLDATNPDLSAFRKRGGKMVVAIGTNDTLASPGAQLDYYQSVLSRMGRTSVDTFARFYVLPQTGHGLTGNSYATDGDGRQIESRPIPSTFDRFALLVDWVENGKAPGKSVTVTAAGRSLPMCSYPEYPKYAQGPPENAASYTCGAK